MPRPTRSLLLALTLALTCGCFASRRVHPRSAEELRRGYALLAAGDSERAEVAFSHALEFDPDLVEGENGLGVVARTRGDLPEATRRFRRALDTNDSFAEAHANLGEAMLAAGDPLMAARSLRAALALNPDLVEARHNLGRALLRAGLADAPGRERHWADARRTYLHVLETDARRASALSDLALIDFLSARPARAEAGWSSAASLDPSDASAALGLCLARTVLGRCREALPECERCVRLSPDDERCAEGLGAAQACGRGRNEAAPNP